MWFMKKKGNWRYMNLFVITVMHTVVSSLTLPSCLKNSATLSKLKMRKIFLKKLLFSLHFLFSLFCKMQHLQQPCKPSSAWNGLITLGMRKYIYRETLIVVFRSPWRWWDWTAGYTGLPGLPSTSFSCWSRRPSWPSSWRWTQPRDGSSERPIR